MKFLLDLLALVALVLGVFIAGTSLRTDIQLTLVAVLVVGSCCLFGLGVVLESSERTRRAIGEWRKSLEQQQADDDD